MPWSPSQAWAYRTCPRMWKLRYRTSDATLRATPKAETALPVRLGTLAHLGLEAAYKDAAAGMAMPGRTMAPFADVAIDTMREACARLGFTEDDDADIDVAIDEVTSVLHTLRRPHPGAILGVEMTLPDEFDGVERVNVVDLILRTGRNSIHIRDWKRKSVKALPLTADLADDPQLCSNRLAVARHYPWATTVTGGLYSLISNREVEAEIPLRRAIAVMEGEAAVIRKAESDTECVPTPNGSNCQRCAFKAACPVWTGVPLP